MKKGFFILFFLLLFVAIDGFCQIQVKSDPASVKYSLHSAISYVSPKAVQAKTDYSSDKKPLPLYAGYIVHFPKNLITRGQWKKINSKKSVWRLGITIPEAGGLNIYFKDVNLQYGQQLFVYDPSYSLVLGAFTPANNGMALATEFIPGDSLVIELVTDAVTPLLPFVIDEIGISVLNLPSGDRGFGDAGFCEVLVNCPEGDDWQNEKRGVARVLVREGSSLFWCSGSLINNTKNDGEPYFLTADHCGQDASEADFSKWVFYFNFESKDCEFPVSEPVHQSLSGAKLIASSQQGTSTGSDFKLLLLFNSVPKNYHPYYNGWNRTGEISQSAVGIHHPEGDLKMISNADNPLVSTRYNDPSPDPSGKFWKVIWSKTESGHGVTEGGSSGSPLFDPAGYIVGQLSGGRAACSSTDLPDYYGKFSESWESNGDDSTRQLRPWLDPLGSEVQVLRGFDPDTAGVIAAFSSDVTEISVGGQVQFYNKSEGNFTSAGWYFPGGDPETSEMPDPLPVNYSKAGEYDVKLVVRSTNSVDSLIRKNYIRVLPNIIPNPSTTGKFKIIFGSKVPDDLDIQVTDLSGRGVRFYVSPGTKSSLQLDLSTSSPGVYLVKIITSGNTRVLQAIVSK